jgi:hypothetical protein
MSSEIFLGKQRIVLEDRDFVAEGGEGRIYGKGELIYKIYTDKGRTIPPRKVAELAALDHPAILRPLELVRDKAGDAIGFTMRWQKQAVPLCRLFSNDFRSRSGMGTGETAELVENMARIFSHIHSRGCLVVDANEMNFLVDGANLTSPYFIDVDSYQTPGFPATAIMDSVRDHCATGFSQLSDWFAFAVLATQLFIGIHPYKGTHPAYGKGELKRRMEDHVSVFNREVRLPGAVRDFGVIPRAYREWLERVLERGERLAPPGSAGGMVAALPRATVTTTTARFVMELLREFPAPVTATGDDWVISGGTLYSLSGRAWGAAAPGSAMVRTPGGRRIMARVRDGRLALAGADGTPLALDLAARAVMACNELLVAVGEEHAVVIGLEELGDRVIPCIRGTWEVMPHATTVLDGLLHQNLLGRAWLNIFHLTPAGKAACLCRHFRELDGYRVMEGRHRQRVAMILGERQGRYDLFTFRFAADFGASSCTVERDVPYQVPNFVVLDNGTAIRITGDDELHLFRSDPQGGDVTTVKDQGTTMEMKLCLVNGGVGFTVGSRLYGFRMAKGGD